MRSAARPVRIAVAGALGRMGQAVTTVIQGRDDVVVAGLFDRPELAGRGDIATRDEAIETADVVIDFTTPDASCELAETAAGRGAPALVVGSTGFAPEHLQRLTAAARRLPVVCSGNFSVGVNVLVGLVEQAARLLSPEYDIEVLEAHHRRKVDAPSGTALMLGNAAARGRNVDLGTMSERGRDGMTGVRGEGAIGFAVLRGGGIVGEHSVIFAAEDEIVTLGHSARDRTLFARGAVEAALWAAARAAEHRPGLYDMQDVLGFRTSSDHGHG
jgi:4-hydroxy-tetrahydrodipicolinate reductase